MKIVFINVPWMKYYTGEGDEETLVPSCGYNFQYVNGFYYGYGEGLDNIDIENIGVNDIESATKYDEIINNVTVVWTSYNREGVNKIIGWYKEATIYRNLKSYLSIEGERLDFKYSIVAPADKAILLPIEERELDAKEIPEGITFEKDEKYISDIAMYIHNYAGDQMNYVFAKKDVDGKSVLNLEDYEMYFIKADEFLAKNLYGKAVRCFNKAIEMEPCMTMAYSFKASIFLSLKMYDEAIEVYKQILRIDVEDIETKYCLGLAYGLIGKYDECKEYIGEYLKSEKYDINAETEQAIACYHLGEKDAAKNVFVKALKEEPENPVFKELCELTIE